ncbi:MAG: PAS domain S-box protein [Candidatus Helarchaeota archaeon]
MQTNENFYEFIFNNISLPIIIWEKIDGEFILKKANIFLQTFFDTKISNLNGCTAKEFFIEESDLLNLFQISLEENIIINEFLRFGIKFTNKSDFYHFEVIPLNSNELAFTIFNLEFNNLRNFKINRKYLFEMVFNCQKDAIFILNADNPPIFLDCNKAAIEMFGYEKDELIGKTTEIVHLNTDFLRRFQEMLYPEIEKKGYFQLSDFYLKRKDGSIFPTMHMVVPLLNSRGDRIGWISQVSDITYEKNTEKKLKESEEKYRQLFNNANDAIFLSLLDENGNLSKHIEVNQKACDLLGYTKEEIYKKRPLEISKISPLDLKRITKSLKTDSKITFEWTFINKKGEEIPVEVSSHRFKLNGSQVILSIIRDISERKKIELELKKSEENYRLITENANDLIAVTDLNLNFIYINEQIHKNILGFTSADLIGRNIFDFMHNEDRKKALEIVKKNFDESRLILRFKKKNNGYIWLESKGKLFINRDKEKRILFISRDITKLKNILDELKNKNKELIELDKLKDQFFADISHEFRTPLTSIKGFTEILLKSINKSFDYYSDLKTIYNNILKLENLVKELINYTRLKANKIEFKKDRFKFSEILNNLLKTFELELKYKNIKIIPKIISDGNLILDKSQTIKIVQNLISNAIKFSNNNSEILITSDIKDNVWYFSITDYGIGIEKKDIPLIFTRFSKLKTTLDKNLTGLGLGLSICKKIIEKYHGKIWVESEGLNKGTTFYFEIPLTS